jgi:hypothetical protein
VSAVAISWTVFAGVFAGAVFGMLLRKVLPDHHLGTESKDIVRLGMGLIATMSALVLGLLIASAQSSYGTQRSEFTQMSSNIILLDRVLAHYGPETSEIRDLLRGAVVRMLNQVSPVDGARPGKVDPTAAKGEVLYDKLQALRPQSDGQRSLQAQALSLMLAIGQTRWLMFEQAGRSIPMPFLVVLVSWLAFIFLTFGLYAPPNATVVTILLVCALSIAGAIFLILELDEPFGGWMQISTAPLRNALSQLGQ